MAYDINTSEDEMLWELGDSQFGGYNEDAVNEFRRRSELAAKYERLTQALAALSARSDEFRFVCLAKDGIELHHGKPADVDWRFTKSHDGTPDGIAAAIIAADEGA